MVSARYEYVVYAPGIVNREVSARAGGVVRAWSRGAAMRKGLRQAQRGFVGSLVPHCVVVTRLRAAEMRARGMK